MKKKKIKKIRANIELLMVPAIIRRTRREVRSHDGCRIINHRGYKGKSLKPCALRLLCVL